MSNEYRGPVVRWTRLTRSLRIGTALALPLLLALIISACDSGASSGPAPAEARVHVTATPSRYIPDPAEKTETTPAGQLPSFATADAAVEVLYQSAMQHTDVLGQMACYCGCATYQHPHTSLMSCFIKTVNADGSITWTDHSMSCDICTGIAKMTMTGISNATPLAQLRDAIHQKYKYTGVWTDTPPPTQ